MQYANSFSCLTAYPGAYGCPPSPRKPSGSPMCATATPARITRDIRQFIAFVGLGSADQLREVTRPHVLAWRDQLQGQGLANDTIRRKLAALSSLSAYLCDCHAVLHNPVLGVRCPPSMNRDGATPAL